MKLELEERVQRTHNFAIVDEVDSILIDESRTPLIISGPTNKATEMYLEADKIVRQLQADKHFEIELKSKQTMLTDEGVQRVEQILGIDNLYEPEHIEFVHHVTQSLKGHSTMKRDIDYVVRDGQIVIVDEFTGRMMTGRRWSDGLHQAVEAKEGVAIRQENQTLATITFQNYFRMYDRLSGMTGTADTEAVEFGKIYGLSVTVIPTNEPLARVDHPDIVYPTEAGKYRAVCREIAELHEKGQPILVGTASISHSEMVSEMLNKQNVKHTVLNAKQHEREAEIVAQAGRIGAVTISTNMAGRGTDIVLGVKVLESGGLHILGTERHESRRIDNQLRGRAGRQGDPGSSRFFVSLEDDLMKRFGGERMQALMTRMGLQEDDAIEGGLVARAIENAQKKVEGHHFDIRKHLLEYDDVLNKQREVVYSLRQRIMRNEGLEENIDEMISDVLEDIILTHAPEKEPVATWNVEAMFLEFHRTFGIEIDAKEILENQETASKELAQELFERKAHVGDENILKLIHIVYLQSIDHFWKEHLSNMDHLKEGIGLRGYGQKNPLHEYQRESFELFTSMMVAVKGNVLQNVFLVELLTPEQLEELERREREALKAQEEAAKTVHRELNEPEEAKSGAAKGGNRRQRRKQSKRKGNR
ncbi:UNVERIFIED_CONTAM: hypothetical protein GTU68_044139 [Idotea baltica]|nr:hypothetical protein [Idotea baltica]